MDRLADTVVAMEERQSNSSKSIELIHVLVSILKNACGALYKIVRCIKLCVVEN